MKKKEEARKRRQTVVYKEKSSRLDRRRSQTRIKKEQVNNVTSVDPPLQWYASGPA